MPNTGANLSLQLFFFFFFFFQPTSLYFCFSFLTFPLLSNDTSFLFCSFDFGFVARDCGPHRMGNGEHWRCFFERGKMLLMNGLNEVTALDEL